MVLIVEALDTNFGARFWEYIKMGGYEHRQGNTDTPQFYRFTKLQSPDYPVMIELFSRRSDGITLPPEAVLTPLPLEDNISSLSAILLDNDYYEILKTGIKTLDGVPVLEETHLIPFKANAWLALSSKRQTAGMLTAGTYANTKTM